MKKKIIPIVALVLVLSMVMSVNAFAAAEPVDDVTLINNILNEGCAEVNAKVGEYAELSNDGRKGDTWFVTVAIKDPTVKGLDVYSGIINTLVDKLNEHSNELTSFAPLDDPEAAITLDGSEVNGNQVINFILALGLKNAAGGAYGPNDPIGDLVDQGFVAVITTKAGVDYYWDVYFA